MNTRKILTAMLLAVLITAAVGIVAADSEAEGASPRLTLTSAVYDSVSDTLTISGASTETQLWFQITDEQSTLKVSSESIIVRNGSYTQDVLLNGYTPGMYTVIVYIEEGFQKITESRQFMVTEDTVSITPERHSVGLFVDETRYLRFALTGCSYKQVSVTVSDPALISAETMTSDCRIAVTGLSAGTAVLRVSYGDVFAEVSVIVSERAVPSQPLEFTFGIQIKVDSETADMGSSGYTAADLRKGITLKGTGFNAGEALENACNAKHIPNEFLSEKDADGNDLRYWVVQIFGLGDVQLEDGDWKYWVQEYDNELNLRTLGWYTDNTGIYILTYRVTSIDFQDDIRSIYVKNQPSKTEYIIGESFDSTGMVVMADMFVGEDVPVENYTVTPAKFTEAGTQNVTITYKGETATVQVTVNERAPPTVDSITVSEPPDKTKYTVGETLDQTGMVVKALMSDGTSKEITGYTVSPTKFTKTGNIDVTVTYEGKTATFAVTVTTPEITITADKTELNLYEGDSETVSFTLSGCTYEEVRVESNNSEKVTADDMTYDCKVRIHAEDAGSANVRVSCGDKAVEIQVHVSERQPSVDLKEFTFEIKIEIDIGSADFGNSEYSEGDLEDGITIKGWGTNAGEALENACNTNKIPNEFLNEKDANGNDLRYWVIQIFGLGDVPVGGNDWKSWIQEHDGEYNQKTLGWLTDNSGVYTLTYGITGMDHGNDIESIYVKEQPTKTEYTVGESFDPTGMVVMAKLKIGGEKQIFNYNISPERFSSAGEQEVKITYRGETAEVKVNVTGGSTPSGPGGGSDAPDDDDKDDGEDQDEHLEDEETKTDEVTNEDGSKTTTTTTTGKNENGEDVKIVEEVTEKDGTSETKKTETVTDKDGNEVGSKVTESKKDKDGNTETKTTETKTDDDGSKVSTTTESKLDKDGNGKTETETVTEKADGSKVTKETVTEKSAEGTKETVTDKTVTEDKVQETKVTETKDADGKSTGKQTETKTQETLKDSEGNETGTLTAETKETVGKDGKSEKTEDVAVESKDGNVKTEATSKTDKDGNVKAETTTTVKSETKDVGTDAIDAALKQSEQALSNISADKTEVTKTVEVEVSSGTSAALSPEAVKKVSDYGAGLKVSGSEGSIDTDSDVLKNLAKDGKTVELSMEANNMDVLKEKQKDVVGDNHFVDLNALVGGENVHQLGGKAIITFGYQLKDGESAVDLKIFYVDDEGNKTLIDATFADGSFTMTVDHFSVYMVENVSASESDDGGISPVLIAGILVVLIAAIVGVVLYTRKN